MERVYAVLKFIGRAFMTLTAPRDFYIHRAGRVHHVRFARWAQTGLLCACVAGFGWFANVTVIYFGFDRILDQKNTRIAKFEQENARLALRVNSMRDNMSYVAGTLKQSHHNLVGLLSQNDRLRADLDKMQDQLKTSEAKRAHQIKRYSALNRKLLALESRLEGSNSKGAMLAQQLNNVRNELGRITVERNKLDETRVKSNSEIAQLQERVERLREEQREAMEQVGERTVADIRQIESVFKLAGLDPRSMLRKLDPETFNQGGPFVSAPDGKAAFATGPTAIDRHVAYWDALRRVKSQLPLAAPLDEFKIASKYGKRRDPINRKWAMHSGIDLSVRHRTPVLAPAPGRVVYTGWKGHYGRFIEIDHGLGVRTRYGHLRRIYVRRGQRVDYRKKIGQVGSSGRSTGPHLHYEIIVDGKRVDPAKFLKAGRNVFKG